MVKLSRASHFQTHFCQGQGIIWQVEAEHYFRADMSMLSHQTVLVFSYLANSYWLSQAAPHTSSIWEVLLVPPVKVLQRVQHHDTSAIPS
ncbi:MAG: hypothetical protein V7K27_32895 [Nostoc sp.]|uniref:hypothetical protein n=1 Tax=Nostoc sp. TaxID=1180 RepID=UPI002FF8F110